MFRDLYAVARHTPLHLIITPNGEQLKIIVTPKPSGDAADNPALAKPFSAIGTPEELDAEFPGALRTYTTAVNELRASINLPLDLLEEAKKKAAKKDEKKAEKERLEKEEAERRSAGAKKAAETRAQKAEAERVAREQKAKAREDAKAAKKAGKAGAGAGIQLPGGGAAPASPAPAPKQEGRAGLPGKPECLADYRELKAKHGDKLKRRLFIKKAKTGRRYEKLWQNWEAFVKEADRQAELPIEPRGAQPAASAATDVATGSAEVKSVAAPEPRKVPVLENTSREVLGMHPTEGLKAESVISIENVAGSYLVDSVTPDVQILAHRVHEQPWLLCDESGKELGRTRAILGLDAKLTVGDEEYVIAGALDQVYTLRPVKPRFQVYLEGTDELITEYYKWPPQVGERLDIADRGAPFRVVMIEGQRVHVRQLLAAKKSLISTAGEKVGTTDEIYEIADQVTEIEDKEWRVVAIEETSYTVKAAKPHIKGPAAAPAHSEA